MHCIFIILSLFNSYKKKIYNKKKKIKKRKFNTNNVYH